LIVEDIDIIKLDFEWRILSSIFDDEQKEELEIDEMYSKIVAYKDFNEKERILSKFNLLIEVILSFLHSNAEAERIFSIVQM